MPKAGDRVERKRRVTTAGVAICVSIISVCVSLWSLFLTEKSYEISHRAFIGVIEATPRELRKDDQLFGISWQINYKNVGTIPGTITNVVNTVQVIEHGETRFANAYGEPNKSVFLLPGGVGQIGGSMPAADFQKVIKGDAKAEVILEVRYHYLGLFWEIERYYKSKLQMAVLPNQPVAFAPIESEGN